jgi:hypothetical protein
MSVRLPNGSVPSIASTIGAAIAMSALSNAANAVGTLAASHGVTEGDIVILSSGWSDVDARVARVSNVDTNDVTFEGINTANTDRFPAGSGTGSVRVVSAWTQLSGILNFEGEGGDQEYWEGQFLEARRRMRIPTVRAAQGINMALADRPALPWYAAVEAADDGAEPVPMRLVLKGGGILFYNGYWSLNRVPTTTVNDAMTLAVAFALAADVTRYAS